MLLNEYYFTNTTAGHNKDYRITVDFSRMTVTSEWGPIGGTKATRTLTFRSNAEMEECVRGKRERRLRRGYTEHADVAADVLITAIVREDINLAELERSFALDAREMMRAERV